MRVRRAEIDVRAEAFKKQLWDDAKEDILAENTNQETGDPILDHFSTVTQK